MDKKQFLNWHKVLISITALVGILAGYELSDEDTPSNPCECAPDTADNKTSEVASDERDTTD